MLVESDFTPHWFLKSPHLQTIIASLFRPTPKIGLHRERIELEDGDFLDLDWIDHVEGKPLVILFHGLEGHSRANYAAGLLKQLEMAGLNAVVMHFRNCSEEPNRLPRSYHAGETGDLEFIIQLMHQRQQFPAIAAVGFSLGGNVLLKWLGEAGSTDLVTAAAAVSVPFRLEDGAKRMGSGLSRVYEQYLMRRMKKSAAQKSRAELISMPASEIRRLSTLYDFDDKLTAPIHGFSGYKEYYDQSSSRQYIRGIEVPTLILHASDDPFMYKESMPNENELSDVTTLEWSRYGGHVGFISDNSEQRFWLEHRLKDWAVQAFT